ncbi:hypothetical protein [Virgisporangium aurantiacum]|uniref:Uncharacterized protein n=1 Tax=Virgisporangium aurantiacum TaxID=175570 RepID=A0A8J4DXY5_9ACTN|nr:hypothetical protein [Virgisporangium aurantiacum]GIJ55075.1 hypothetical protein Vau01_025910 [Virgisporangium aurantiacum]
MTSVLEDRYRSLLRILPADYRAAWEEEMVATFLTAELSDDPEDAEYQAEFGRPGLAEVASVVGLAVRLRLPAGGSGRDPLLGNAVRLVALIGLLVSAAAGVVGTGTHLWLIGKLPGVAPPDLGVPPTLGVLPTTRVLLVAAALPAYLLLVTGHQPAARVLASVSLGAVLITAVGDLFAGYPLMAGRWLSLLLDVLVFATLWAHHADAPPVPRRPWLLALPAAIAVAVATFVLTVSVPVTWWLVDWPAIACTLVAVGLAVHLVRRGGPEWSLALVMLGTVVLAQRLVTLPESVDAATAAHHTPVLVAGLVEIAAVAVAGLPVALWTRRAWRRLPADPVETARA